MVGNDQQRKYGIWHQSTTFVAVAIFDYEVQEPLGMLIQRVWEGSEMLPERGELEGVRLFCMGEDQLRRTEG